MVLKTVKVQHFRNYKNLCLELDSLLNIFTGDNGAGKSSFLEAIYCGLRGKSFQPFISSQFIQKGHQKSQVVLNLKEPEGLSEISSSFFVTKEQRLQKNIFYCGKKTSPSFLEKKFPCLVFTEASMKCLRQGSEQRRLLIDDFLSQSGQNQVRSRFLRSFKQKQFFLKDLKNQAEFTKETEKNLLALNKVFLESSLALVKERLNILKTLFNSLELLKPLFFKNPVPNLAFSYSLKEGPELKQNDELFSILKEDLEKKTKWEIRAGALFSGPQRHDIRFLFNGEDSRVFCSKGEQRLLMLSLLVAFLKGFPQAFLFLDDVLMELDETTQVKLLQFLEKNHCQTFLTNCKVIPFRTKNMSFFSVKKGIIKKYEH